MPDNKKINTLEFAKQARAAARRAAAEGDRAGGLELWRAIGAALKQLDIEPEARPEYETARRDAWFAAVPLLSDQAVVDGLRDYALDILFEEDYNISAALREKLAGIFVLEERDQLRGKLRDALLSAAGTVSEKIALPDGTREGTPEQWLMFYLDRVGGAAPDTLKRSEFLAGRAVVQLPGPKQKILRQFLELFDYLRLSSLTAAGYEEDLIADFDDKLLMMSGGKVVQIDPAQDELMSKTMPQLMSGLKQIWARQAAELTEMEQEARKTAEAMPPDKAIAALTEMLEGRAGKDPKGALTAVYAAVQGGVKSFMEKIYPALERALAARSSAAQFAETLKLTPASPPAFQLFLKTLFEEKLGLASGYAAALAARLAGALGESDKKTYRTIAYYDFESGEFKWSA